MIDLIKGLSEELRTVTTHAFPNNIDFKEVVRLSKSTAIILVSVCVRRSKALSCRQKVGETFRHVFVMDAVTD